MKRSTRRPVKRRTEENPGRSKYAEKLRMKKSARNPRPSWMWWWA